MNLSEQRQSIVEAFFDDSITRRDLQVSGQRGKSDARS